MCNVSLIILVFGAVPVVQAVAADINPLTEVTCNDPTKAWTGKITDPDQIDYYSINLVAGQVLTIDVDAETIGSSLDSYLVFLAGDGSVITFDYDTPAPGEKSLVDPYLQVSADVAGLYYLGISAATPDGGYDTGDYTFFLECSLPSVRPVKVGDLLGATGSNSGSLLNIDPSDASSSLRFSLISGQIADIEYDPSRKVLFAAVDIDDHGSIVTINPDDGSKSPQFNYDEKCWFTALESAGGILYGVYASFSSGSEQYSLVTIDRDTGEFTYIEPFRNLTKPISSLTYHSSDKALYGVMGNALVKLDLTLGTIVPVGDLLVGTIVSIEFDPDNFLYVATAPDLQGNPGKLFQINHANLEIMREAGSLDVSTGSLSGLTFVVGESQDEEPVKTLCSSSVTSATTASSETDAFKLSKLKIKNNPLHRAIGLFKFQGKAGEKITLRLTPEEEEAVVAGEESSLNTLVESWLECRGKGRVFLGIRDAIPNVDFRVRKKDQIPFDMTAELPADGYYYLMVIRPLLRFYQTDYCLTLESDLPDSEAWKTLDVVWPGDDSDEDSATASTEAKAVAVQSDEVFDEGSLGSEDTALGETTGIVPTLTGSEPVSDAPATIAPEPVDEGSSQEVQALEETAIDETGEVAPAEEPTTEATEEATMMGGPSIPEETAIDETGEVAPEKSADEISGDNESADGSGSAEVAEVNSDGAESAEGGTSDVVEEDPTEASTL